MRKIQFVKGQLVNLLTYNGITHICESTESPNTDVLVGLDARQVSVNDDSFVYVNGDSVEEIDPTGVNEPKQYFEATSDFIITTIDVDLFGTRPPRK